MIDWACFCLGLVGWMEKWMDGYMQGGAHPTHHDTKQLRLTPHSPIDPPQHKQTYQKKRTEPERAERPGAEREAGGGARHAAHGSGRAGDDGAGGWVGGFLVIEIELYVGG